MREEKLFSLKTPFKFYCFFSVVSGFIKNSLRRCGWRLFRAAFFRWQHCRVFRFSLCVDASPVTSIGLAAKRDRLRRRYFHRRHRWNCHHYWNCC
jgi:hypothetical protein